MFRSSSLSDRNSHIKIATGLSTINFLFSCWVLLYFVRFRMVSSIISQVYKLCCIAPTTAFKQRSILLKCNATIALSGGGKMSNDRVISVVNANVPSLPAKSWHILKSLSELFDVNRFDFINSSIA